MNNIVDTGNFTKELDIYCAVCKEFLCLPIRIDANGLACGRCPPYGDDEAFKHPLLESILKEFKFSCKYKENGCLEDLPLDFVKEHESKCLHGPCECFYLGCSWRGLLVDLQNHCCKMHNASILENNLVVKLEENLISDESLTVRFVSFKNVLFIFQFKYENKGKRLCFGLTYISGYIEKASYTIYANGKARNIYHGLAVPYNCFSINPRRATLSTEIPNTLDIQIMFENYNCYNINYTSNIFLCKKCGSYLVPELYDYQPLGNICGSCANKDNSVISKDQSLIHIIKNANFPCKWKNCFFILKANKLHLHEELCRFYVYDCIICNGYSGILEDMKNHLVESHEYNTYYEKIGSYISIPKSCRIFSIKFNAFILLTITSDSSQGVNVVLKKIGPSDNIGVYIQFGHDHCNINSQKFCIVNECLINAEMLPVCFRDSSSGNVHASVEVYK